MYLGNLSKFTPEQRLLLLHRLEAFLQSRYDSLCDDISVEQAAISYYSRYYTRHIKGNPKVGAGSGGGIVPDVLPDVAIISEFENRQGEFFMLTNWSTPKDEVKQIYDALGFKYQRSAGFFCKVAKHNPS